MVSCASLLSPDSTNPEIFLPTPVPITGITQNSQNPKRLTDPLVGHALGWKPKKSHLDETESCKASSDLKRAKCLLLLEVEKGGNIRRDAAKGSVISAFNS